MTADVAMQVMTGAVAGTESVVRRAVGVNGIIFHLEEPQCLQTLYRSGYWCQLHMSG